MRCTLAFLLAAACAAAHADSWPSAAPARVTSRDGTIVVHMTPGNSIGDVVGFAGADKGPYAQATYSRRGAEGNDLRYQAIKLLNPVAPVFVAVNDTGELVTLDNWHNMGYGKVVVVYAADGKLRRSYQLADMYSPEEIKQFPLSVSSVWWRCPVEPVFDAPALVLNVRDRIGNVLAIEMKSGLVRRVARHAGC
jgi:hypothetical protein